MKKNSVMWPYSSHIFTPAGANPTVPIKIGKRRELNSRAARYCATHPDSGGQSLLVQPSNETTYGASFVYRKPANQERNREIVEARKSALLRRKTIPICRDDQRDTTAVLPTFKTTYSQSYSQTSTQSRPRDSVLYHQSFSSHPKSSISNERRKKRAAQLEKENAGIMTTYRTDFGTFGENPRDRMLPGTVCMDKVTEKQMHEEQEKLRHSIPRKGEHKDSLKLCSTTRDLSKGTTRYTDHISTYTGHIPQHQKTLVKMNDSYKTADKARKHTRDFLRHQIHRHMPNYTGAQPKSVFNDRSPGDVENFGRKTTTSDFHNGQTHAGDSLLSTSREFNIRRAMIENLFTRTQSGLGKDDGISNAERFYPIHRPLEGRFKFGSVNEQHWIKDNQLKRNYMFLGS